MSTTDNGLPSVQSVTARTKTWGAAQQVTSADLNNIQDDIIQASQDAQTANSRIGGRTATVSLAHSPAPEAHGGATVWVEATTNGTTEVVLDDSMDWRHRNIIVEGLIDADTATEYPGGANDNNMERDLGQADPTSVTQIHKWTYTEDGQASGAAANPGIEHRINFVAEYLRIYADSATGALTMRKDAHASINYRVQLCIRASPYQNH